MRSPARPQRVLGPVSERYISGNVLFNTPSLTGFHVWVYGSERYISGNMLFNRAADSPFKKSKEEALAINRGERGTCNLQESFDFPFRYAATRYFYEYVFGSIIIGVRSGKWAYRDRQQWPGWIAMSRSIKLTCASFHSVWNEVLTKRRFWVISKPV